MTMNNSDNLEAERLDGPQGKQPTVDVEYLIERLPHTSKSEINKLTIAHARAVLADIDIEYRQWERRAQSLAALKQQVKSALLGNDR